MRYDIRAFNSEVRRYGSLLRPAKGSLFVVFPVDDARAYYSLAPLSRAVHELGLDMHAMGVDGDSDMLDVLYNTWLVSETPGPGNAALKAFISEVEKKARGFSRLFQKPEIILKSGPDGFVGTIQLPYLDHWFREDRHPELKKTAEVIWSQVFNLKKGESVSIGFQLILKKKDTDKPLQDYLDSFPIARAMMLAAKSCGRVSMNSSTPRKSMLEPMNRVSDLKTTILGCELSKNIPEPVFRRFSALSGHIKSHQLRVSDATFFISGKGYPGKHMFGDAFGYPDPQRKTRWESPGGFIYKLDYYPQTKHDSRKPMSRVGFTDTLPIDLFIKTCNVDWFEIKRKDDRLRRIADRSEKIVVRSNLPGKYQTNFEVGLVANGRRRIPRGSDVDVRSKINKRHLKMTGVYAGNMANLPGGEMFVTPEWVRGTIVGDVVISIDQSYLLSDRQPIIISSTERGYRILAGPKKVLAKLSEKKRDAWKRILRHEKSGSLPKEIIEIKKRNFNMIGEFAVNTNPKAELSDYLIVNEKIAKMIHIALGSGFEADRATEYHTDIVINAPRQKLDIYGVGKNRRKHWILRRGSFA